MALRPPQHAVDAPIVYVHHADDAWSFDQIGEEREKMTAAGEDPDRHPVAVYHSGKSRYDLNASYAVCGEMRSAAMYLDEAKGPWRWKLKRLPFDDFYQVQSLIGQSYELGAIKACRLGVTGVEGPALQHYTPRSPVCPPATSRPSRPARPRCRSTSAPPSTSVRCRSRRKRESAKARRVGSTAEQVGPR